jgi:hypothetical protein
LDGASVNSVSNIPPTPPTKQQSKSSNNNSNSISSPIVRQSVRNLFPFRNQSPSNVNPVLAFSNDPSVKLTLFRKLDQDQTPTILKSNPNPSSSLFSYQSDSDINHNRSNSSRFFRRTSRHSLPDVPLQRSTSVSTTNVNLVESPVIPKFLCSPSDKHDDEVFITNEQDQVVATSTLSDSSTKSKVLQASFRGKAGTMDRRTAGPLRSSSTSSTSSITTNINNKHFSNIQPKYFQTKTDQNEATPNRPVNRTLDSVLNLTLQLEQTSTAEVERRQSISTDDIDPLLLNGLTDDENTLHLTEKTNGEHSPMFIIDDNNHQTIPTEENSSENDRIQNNSSINSKTIE